ncbi:unnamed protein product [Rotaria sordida]|uniref:Transmembrane protein n=1 Tax=Rotaria sordida TaxID=392033 RepID=A0A816ADS9_9BILA|nr:unnamed protein product [Rotaria sordida]
MQSQSAKGYENVVESFTNKDNNAISQSTPLTSNQNSAGLIKALRRTRVILLTLISIEIACTLFYFIWNLVALISYSHHGGKDYNNTSMDTLIGTVVASFIALIYEIIFLCVVIKYIRTGILICACIGILQLVYLICLIVLLIIAIVITASAAHNVAGGIVLAIVIIVIIGIANILSVLRIIYAFKVARLIKEKQAHFIV